MVSKEKKTNIKNLIYIMIVAFMCHHNTFLLYTSLQDANQKRWDIITHISLTTSLIVACMFGIGGYATFTVFSQGKYLHVNE